MGGSYAGAYLLKRGLFMPWVFEYVIDVDMVKEGLRRLDPLNYIYGKLGNDNLNAFSKVATLESSLYMRNQLLRDTDWSSMAHSLEVRTPLVDASLLYKLAVPLSSSPTLAGKHLLANSPSHSLPAQVVNRPKSGFSTPINDWQKQDVSCQAWRKKPILNETSCPWARRWSYSVFLHLK